MLLVLVMDNERLRMILMAVLIQIRRIRDQLQVAPKSNTVVQFIKRVGGSRQAEIYYGSQIVHLAP